MQEIICQKDEECKECGEPMPKGTFGYISSLDELLDEPCKVNAEECGIFG